MRVSFFAGSLAFFFLQCTSSYARVLAPVDPGAQEFNRQQERERLLRQQQEATPAIQLERPAMPDASRLLPADKTPCIPIHALVLDGALSDQVQWLLKAADATALGRSDAVVGRCLNADGINLVMKRMQDALVKQGYVTSRYWQSVAGANQTLLYSGHSSNEEIRLSHLLYRSAVRKTTLSLSGWARASGNFIEDAEILVHRGNERGLKIKTRCGSAIFPHEARDWSAHHPVAHATGLSPPVTASDASAGLFRPAIFTEYPSGECA